MPRATITDLSNQLFWTRHELAQVKAENRRLKADAARRWWMRKLLDLIMRRSVK